MYKVEEYCNKQPSDFSYLSLVFSKLTVFGSTSVDLTWLTMVHSHLFIAGLLLSMRVT